MTTPPLIRPRAAIRGLRRRTLIAYGLLLPSGIGLIAFLLIPLLAVVALSFFDWNFLGPARFVGLGNYEELLGDGTAWNSLGLTIGFTLIVVPGIALLSLALAVLVDRKLPGIRGFRVLLLLPWIGTPVAIGTIYSWIYDSNNGLLNEVLGGMGLPEPRWLQDPQLALASIAFVTIWQFAGYNMLFFLAGLQGIPDELYQAARVDGAGRLRTFWSVTLPLLRPTAFFVIITATIGSFQAFDLIAVMTEGGPGAATKTLLYYIYQQGFQVFRAGYAATLSVLLFVVIMLVTLLQAFVLRRANERLY